MPFSNIDPSPYELYPLLVLSQAQFKYLHLGFMAFGIALAKKTGTCGLLS
jgi:hypothetical protein